MAAVESILTQPRWIPIKWQQSTRKRKDGSLICIATTSPPLKHMKHGTTSRYFNLEIRSSGTRRSTQWSHRLAFMLFTCANTVEVCSEMQYFKGKRREGVALRSSTQRHLHLISSCFYAYVDNLTHELLSRAIANIFTRHRRLIKANFLEGCRYHSQLE